MHPPSDPPLPPDRAVYGSKTGALDKAEAAASSADVAAALTGFDAAGWDFASDMLGYYLGNNGPDFEYRISTANFAKVVATGDVKEAISRCLESIRNQARRDPQIGVRRELTSIGGYHGWEGVDPTDNNDVHFALGHFAVAVGSDTTVYESEGGAGPRAEIFYKVYVYDYYNFDRKGGIRNLVNNEARQLEEAGWARSYRARGESLGAERWIGTL